MAPRDVSAWLLKAVCTEAKVLDAIEKHQRDFEKRMEQVGVRNQRIQKNYAQIMALIGALTLVTPITQSQRAEAMQLLSQLALERERELARDHVLVERFWEVYDYLNGVPEHADTEDTNFYEARLNHSRDPKLIAVNLNHFSEVAKEHRQEIPDLHDLKKYLKTSRKRKFVDANVVVSSAINARYNGDRSPAQPPRPTSIRCWVFKVER
jgi:hypothetical protein